jgi:hypothetical protein
MHQRFDGIDKTLLDVRRDIARLNSGQEHIIRRLDGQENWLRFVVGDLRNEKGQTLEDMFAAALRYGLKNPDITADNIRLRQKIEDTEARFFPFNYSSEVDIIAENGEFLVFDVKASADADHVDMFAMKVKLAAHLHPDKKVRGVFTRAMSKSDNSLGARAACPPQCRRAACAPRFFYRNWRL